ncbi:GTP-binding protein Rho1 [Marasmius crinis-equi]|uniref:GTP-binding protein Rho1 n=1 Tax=Marasmius crinis-equi TaxID=585013 RepID=A0ABR3FLX2_9AGAR
MTTEEKADFKKTILLVGNSGCGKTSLVNIFLHGTFSGEHERSKPCAHPSMSVASNNGIKAIDPKSLEEGRQQKGELGKDEPDLHRCYELGGKEIDFTLRDTNGSEDEQVFDALVHEAHVVFVCFAIDDHGSLHDARFKWLLRIQQAGASTPIVLVGCKQDLRKEPKVVERLQLKNLRPISKDEGVITAWRMKPQAKFYAECSSKDCEGVSDVFASAAKLTIPELRTRTWRGRWIERADAWKAWSDKWGRTITVIYIIVLFGGLFLWKRHKEKQVEQE